MNVFGRAELQRTMVLVVALLLTAGSMSALAREFRAGAIDLNRTNVALIGNIVPSMNPLALPFLFRSIEHPASAQLIERIRKVE